MRCVGPVPCVGENCRQGCGGETGKRILGRRRSKCGIILKWKKYEMRTDWVRVLKERTGDQFLSTLQLCLWVRSKCAKHL